MKSFIKLFSVAIAAAFFSAPAMAQENTELNYKPFPHMFIGVQGGVQTTLTNYDNSKLITPTASLSVGGWFTPVVGARLHVNGMWNEGGYRYYDNTGSKVDLGKYDYKYITTDLDLMVNLVTLFGKKDYYPVNLYLIGGIGLNTAWDNDEALAMNSAMPLAWDGTRFSHNARIGAQVDVNLCKNVSLNLEVAANSLSDRYNSKINSKDDWQLTAQLGLAFKFGYKKPAPAPVVVEPEPEPIYETVIDTTWYDDITYKDVKKEGDIDKRIFYAICESDINADEPQIKEVAEFLKEVENGEVVITAYADKGTGNPRLNMQYSKDRALKTKKALIANGVDEKMIKTTEWKGDTVQPYPNDNDKNRVCIITGHGVYVQKEKVVTRKFKTSERKVRVN